MEATKTFQLIAVLIAIYSVLVSLGWLGLFIPDYLPFDSQILLTSEDIIRHRGYPFENHQIVTDDGYILNLHRIPPKPNANNITKAKPVFLQHGLISTSGLWLLSRAEKSIAFILADNGYDVWLGNFRGNPYSINHTTLDPNEQDYWQYSWDEIGKYDVTGSIRYILNVTKHDKVSLIGQSMASALFFISSIEEPNLNDHIDAIIGLGPCVTIATMKGRFFRFLSPLFDYIEVILRHLGVRDFLANDSTSVRLSRAVCNSSRLGALLCRQFIFDVLGHSEDFSIRLMREILYHAPSTVSLKAMNHLFQINNAGGLFQKYDFGSRTNLERYGTEKPPQYNLSLVKPPVYLFWGLNDHLSTPQDVALLAAQLGNLKASIRVDNPKFTHGDLVFSPQLDQYIHEPVMQILNGLSQ